jgi:hypothetical protein
MTDITNTIVTRLQLPEIDKSRDTLLVKIRECENRLYSLEVQNLFEKETDPIKKRKFINERLEVSILRVKLETATLERIAVRLKSFEDDLNEGIANLTEAIASVNNTVIILSAIKNVTGIIARILLII